MKSHSLAIDRILAEIANCAEVRVREGDDRLKRLKDDLSRAYRRGSEERGAVCAILWSYMGSPLIMYYLGFNSIALVELHALLEWHVFRMLPKILADDEERRSVLRTCIDRKTLGELAPALVRLKVWNSDDRSTVSRLKKLRDGIVHNNVGKLMEALGGGDGVDLGDARILSDEHDARPYLVKTPRLILKLGSCGDAQGDADGRRLRGPLIAKALADQRRQAYQEEGAQR